MKKLIPAVLVLLLIWNVVLTVTLIQLTNANRTTSVSVDDMNSINYTTSDYTTAISKVRSSVVSIVDGSAIYSGIIFAKEKETAYILTTAKAIKNEGISVVFDSGAQLQPEIVGVDEDSDVVLLSVNVGFEVKPITMIDTAALAHGANIIAVGGRNIHTGSAVFSAGIISEPGMWRNNANTYWYSSMVETDAALAASQEGGALVDLNGALTGMIITQPFQSNARMSYALATNELKLIYNELKASGNVTKGAFGIITKDIASMLAYEKNARNINIDKKTGLLVENIADNSAAEGILQVGDIIMQFDGQDMKSKMDLLAKLYEHIPGDTVGVSIIRNGEKQQLSVVLQ